MIKSLNPFFLALFLAFISQGIQAQFDDVYYDPDVESVNDDNYNYRNNSSADSNWGSEDEDGSGSDDFDDEYSEWEDQDYYYSSRIRRFHRPYYGFDYYSNVYVDQYYYDPFDYNPWILDRDIYLSSRYYRYGNYRPGWSFGFYYSNPYWSYFDWCLGWNPYSYRYYYYNPYNYHHWGGHHGYYDYGYNHHHYGSPYKYGYNNQNVSYGSRKFGATTTSKHGPVRLNNPSPKVITEAYGNNSKSVNVRETGRPGVGYSDAVPDNGKKVYTPEKRTNVRTFPNTSGVNNERVDDKLPQSSSDKKDRFKRYENPYSGQSPRNETINRNNENRSRYAPHRYERSNRDRKSSYGQGYEPLNKNSENRFEQRETGRDNSFFGKIFGSSRDHSNAAPDSGNSRSSDSKSSKGNSSGGSRKSPR